MKNLKNKKWLLSARPVGMVGEHNFEFLEEEVEDIKEGEFLIKNFKKDLTGINHFFLQNLLNQN